MYDDKVNGAVSNAFGLGGVAALISGGGSKQEKEEEAYKPQQFAKDAENGLSHEKMTYRLNRMHPRKFEERQYKKFGICSSTGYHAPCRKL